MKEILDLLNETKKFYLATVENNKPKIRPFGAWTEFEGKLYIVTSNTKNVYTQMINNPNVCICACNENRKWVRVAGTAILDNRLIAKQKMLDDNPVLLQRKRYTSANDETMAVFYIDDITAELF